MVIKFGGVVIEQKGKEYWHNVLFYFDNYFNFLGGCSMVHGN